MVLGCRFHNATVSNASLAFLPESPVQLPLTIVCSNADFSKVDLRISASIKGISIQLAIFGGLDGKHRFFAVIVWLAYESLLEEYSAASELLSGESQTQTRGLLSIRRWISMMIWIFCRLSGGKTYSPSSWRLFAVAINFEFTLGTRLISEIRSFPVCMCYYSRIPRAVVSPSCACRF